MALIRQGQRLTRRSTSKVVLSKELPRSAGERVAACSRLRQVVKHRSVRCDLPWAWVKPLLPFY